MNYLAPVIFICLFWLSAVVLARPMTEAPDRQHFPAEVNLSMPEISPETQEESDLLVKFAMVSFIPEDFDSFSPEEREGYIEEKLNTLTAILEKYPNSEAAIEALTTLLDHPQYHERLLAELKKLLDKGVHSARLYFSYLAILDLGNKPQEIAELLPVALEHNPDSRELFLLALKFYTEKNAPQKVDELLSRADTFEDMENQTILQIARLKRLLETGKCEDAALLTEQIAQNDTFLDAPEYNVDFIWMAFTPWDANLPVQGYEAIAKLFLAILRKNIAYLDEEFIKNLTLQGALVACAASNYQQVNEFLDCVLEEFSDRQSKREMLFELGNLLNDITNNIEKNQDDIPDGLLQVNIRVGREILKSLPVMYKDDNTDRTIARYLMQGGELEEALKCLKHIQVPNSQDQLLIATVLIHLKRYQEALPIMRKLAEVEKGSLKPPFYLSLGHLEDQCGNQKECDDAMKKALEMEPKFKDAANYLGYSYAERGINLEEAERLIKIALEQSPDNSAYQDSMAWVKFKQGHLNEALRWMAKANHDIDLSKDYQEDRETREELSEHTREILRALHCDYLADFY